MNADQRIVEGIASTPTPDRGGDVMMPEGAQFVLPMPFLWDHSDPIGEVFAADVRPDGIYIQAKVSTVEKPGPVRDRVEKAWASFTADPPLVRGLSIGWKEIESEPIRGTKFTRYLKWIWGELSAVVVPMNTEATILAVKSLDQAASGRHPSGVPDSLPVVRALKGAPPMKNALLEQIANFENTRAAKVGEMNGMMAKAAETGTTLDAEETEKYETLDSEVKAIDAHLPRLRDLEKMNVASATPILAGKNGQPTIDRAGVPVLTIKSNAPKGSAFVRSAIALLNTKSGSRAEAIAYARDRWADQAADVELLLKAAVAAGNTTDATWAGPLAVAQPLVNEFLELLRPATLIGKIPNFRQVPFNVSVPSQTAGGTYQWVGQGAPKPVGALAFSAVTLGIAKAAGIIVLTEELVRISSPSAETTVRQDMTAGMAQYLDTQFIDPSVAAVANVSPGSVTNGTTPITTAGTSPDNARTDLKALVAAFVTANLSTANAVFVMSEANAFALGSSMNALGQPLFPGMGAQGGTIFGIPVITSQSAGTTVALIDARGILMADDGGLTIDVSREASVQMDSAPTDPPTATTVFVSLWQANLVGLKAERYMNWKRGRLASVKYTAASYV